MYELNEKCGVFGIYGKGVDVARLAFFGLVALQHRGQESAGIAVSDGTNITHHKAKGLVAHVFHEEEIKKFSGHIAIGHTRYSTSLGTNIEHAQPIIVRENLFNTTRNLALAHNGNLPSVTALEEFLKNEKVLLNKFSDSRLMALALGHLMEKKNIALEDAAKEAFPLFTGSFSLVAMDEKSLIATRDECGIKPLSLGKFNGAYIVVSETCALDTIGATFIRDVAPGELVVINDNGLHSFQLAKPNQKLDIFEFVYFAMPNSVLLGTTVYDARQRCGVELAKENKIDADLVIPVPETAIPAAIGYSRESGIPMETGLIKNRYVHRTFIEPDDKMRHQGVILKLSAMPAVIRGKRVIVIDDSIVRGTTSRQLVKMIFKAGAKEVHFLVNSPPLRFPDFYGIDTPDQKKLIASTQSVKEIEQFLGVTSLHYLSYKGLLKGIGVPENQFCTSCFTGAYPINLLERAKEVTQIKDLQLKDLQL